jgi:hypothetical protein
MPPLPPEQSRLRASIASNERWAREPDRVAATAAARAGRWQKYLDRAAELAPPGSDEAEITRRAEALRTADMRRMALASVRSRRRRAQRSGEEVVTDGEVA